MLERVLPPTSEDGVTDAERATALDDLQTNFAAYGFASPAAARAAFLKASPRKRFTVGVKIIPTTPTDNKSSVGWTVLKL